MFPKNVVFQLPPLFQHPIFNPGFLMFDFLHFWAIFFVNLVLAFLPSSSFSLTSLAFSPCFYLLSLLVSGKKSLHLSLRHLFPWVHFVTHVKYCCYYYWIKLVPSSCLEVLVSSLCIRLEAWFWSDIFDNRWCWCGWVERSHEKIVHFQFRLV